MESWAGRLGRPLAVMHARSGDPFGEVHRKLAAAGATELERPESIGAWLARAVVSGARPA